ncbi:MAG TPA: GNAT family N-acetyltransferase, partial [Planctomycetota bacterium]|nr:GNAT family N-acetyltransferase [Planctomycetota bacterium]
MTTFTSRPYLPEDARTYVRLAADAFSVARAGARPTESESFVAHIHSDANPAGRSIAALAEHEGRVMGHLSAIPFRFRRREGGELICWQLGLFAVAAELQRGGLGGKLLRFLIAEVARERPGDCAYGYPNPRSLGLLLGWGLEPTAVVPAHVVPPRLRAGRLRDASGAWELSELDAAGAAAALARVRCCETARGRFVRDAAFFRWRVLGADAGLRYEFL